MGQRRTALKSAPTVFVSELPLVPTNDAPSCTSQMGGGGGGGGGVCADATLASESRSGRSESGRSVMAQLASNRRAWLWCLTPGAWLWCLTPVPGTGTWHRYLALVPGTVARHQGQAPYSQRSASAGSVAEARAAGNRHAATAIGTRTTGARAKHSGWSGATPK